MLPIGLLQASLATNATLGSYDGVALRRKLADAPYDVLPARIWVLPAGLLKLWITRENYWRPPHRLSASVWYSVSNRVPQQIDRVAVLRRDRLQVILAQ